MFKAAASLASDFIRSEAQEHVFFEWNQKPVMRGFMPGIHVFGTVLTFGSDALGTGAAIVLFELLSSFSRNDRAAGYRQFRLRDCSFIERARTDRTDR